MGDAGPTVAGAAGGRRAVLAMCVGVLLLVLNDVVAKWLVERYEPLQILFARSLLALPLAAALAWRLGGRGALRSARPGVHALRGALGLLATVAFIASLDALPLAEATALILTAPLIVAGLAVPLLGERIGRRRAMVLAAGFGGALLVVRPGAAAFQPAALLALGAAALYAVVMLTARRVDPRDGMWTMMLHTTAFSALFASAALATRWPAPQATDLALFAATALLGTLGVTLISQAFRMAPAALVAPFDYTAIVWAGLVGWVVWGTVPGPWTWLGAAVIVAGGLLLIRAEADAKG